MKAFPLLSLVVLSFAPAVGFGELFQATVRPYFGLVAVYYWSIYRPDLFPFLGVFGLGLLYDLGSGGIVGLTALLYLLLRGVVGDVSQQFRLQGFIVNWGFWLLVVIIALVLEAVMNGVILGRQISFWSMILNAVASWLLFPAFFVIFEWLRGRFLGDAEGG